MSEYLNVESKKSETQEREKRAETFLRFLNHAQAIDVFHGKKIEEVLGHENQKRNFIEDIKTEEFLGLLNGINGILRGRPKEKWNMDGKGIGLEGPLFGVGYLAPNQKNKPALLEKVLEAAKEMNRNGVDFKDIGLLISSTLNAIHPYGDGNGRTSRLLYLLLVQDFNSETKKELEQSLLRHGRDKIDINLGFIQHEIEDQIEKELGIKNPEINKDQITNLYGYKQNLKFSAEIPEAEKDFFNQVYFEDSKNIFWSVFQYVQEDKEEHRKEYFKMAPLKNYPDRSVVIMDSFSKNLRPEGMKQILDNYDRLKNRYIEILIDCVAHPEKEEYQIDQGGQKISLKDYFERRIGEEIEKRKGN